MTSDDLAARVAALKAAIESGDLTVSDDGEILPLVPKIILALIEDWRRLRDVDALEATNRQLVRELAKKGELLAERDFLRSLLAEAKGALDKANDAVNASYEQAQAEFQDHMKVAGRHETVVSAWRTQSRDVLAKLEEIMP